MQNGPVVTKKGVSVVLALIKLNVLATSPEDISEVAEEIANSTNSELIQTMGNKITLFRARKKNSKINLPK